MTRDAALNNSSYYNLWKLFVINPIVLGISPRHITVHPHPHIQQTSKTMRNSNIRRSFIPKPLQQRYHIYIQETILSLSHSRAHHVGASRALRLPHARAHVIAAVAAFSASRANTSHQDAVLCCSFSLSLSLSLSLLSSRERGKKLAQLCAEKRGTRGWNCKYRRGGKKGARGELNRESFFKSQGRLRTCARAGKTTFSAWARLVI